MKQNKKAVLKMSHLHCISYTSLSQQTLVSSQLKGVSNTWEAWKLDITHALHLVLCVIWQRNMDCTVTNAPSLKHNHLICNGLAKFC